MANPGPSHERAALRALQTILPGGLRPGMLGVIVSRPGVGKTQLLIHLALDRLAAGQPVLHVAVRESVATIRDAYDSTMAGTHAHQKPLERAEAALGVERLRVIHSTRGQAPSVARLATVLDTLHDMFDAQPRWLVIDGMEPAPAEVAELRALAASRGVGVWVAYSREHDGPAADGDVVLELTFEAGQLGLRALAGSQHGPVRLGTRAFAGVPDEAVSSERPLPSACTLYSGGAPGAETAFGAAAEAHGVHEVNFTFDGHVQARKRGAHPLTARELAEGDVSLAYVSRRLRRSYSESASIRRVLQSLWHQVRGAQVVFVVGTIQEDGTVTGGTGWSVELARMWNKRLWVFDQEKDAWFRWTGEEWFAAEPLIDAAAFCGTGSRQLNDAGRAAIDALFERSFGAES